MKILKIWCKCTKNHVKPLLSAEGELFSAECVHYERGEVLISNLRFLLKNIKEEEQNNQ